VLITKDNYIEIGHVECTECSASLDWHTVDDAMKKSGLIALANKKGLGYFGFTCSKCKKTTLHETDIEFLYFIIFGNLIIPEPVEIFCVEDLTGPGFYYYSYFDLKPLNSINFSKKLGLFSTIDSYDSFYIKEKYKGTEEDVSSTFKDASSKEYCSFLLRTNALGPTAEIQFFLSDLNDELIHEEYKSIVSEVKTQDIVKTCQYVENKTGVKVFNRYIVKDEIYFYIDNFCEKYSELIARQNRDRLIKEISAIQHVLEKIDPDNLKKYLSYGDRPFFLKTHQHRITKNLEFLELLCIPDQKTLLSEGIPYENGQLSSGAQKYSAAPKDFDLKIKLTDYEAIADTIWTEFNASYIQELLTVMADNFIEEYINLMKTTVCSFEQIWRLKESYLNKLYLSVQSKYSRSKEKQYQKDLHLKRVIKIEDHYPALKKIITQNHGMLQMKEALVTIGKSRGIDSFLLLGETGTGKELFAKAIHEISGRPGAFIPINCAAIPENMFEAEFFGHRKGAFTGADYDKVGFFEQANGGTIFLDEIGELKPNFQARLLRVLQEKEITPVGGKIKKVDFLLVSATNCDLREMIDAGEFREDLFQRINEYTIPIPSLSERKDDIPLLAKHFIKKFDTAIDENPSLKPLAIDNEALQFLGNYHWRGNVRELERACKLVMAFRKPDDRSDLAISEFNLEKDAKSEKKQKIKQIKKKSEGPGNTKVTDDQVKEALARHNSNKTKAAEELGVTYATILRHCKKFGV